MIGGVRDELPCSTDDDDYCCCCMRCVTAARMMAGGGLDEKVVGCPCWLLKKKVVESSVIQSATELMQQYINTHVI